MEPGKIFVGGLHQQVTSSTLMDYFLQYGMVSDAIVMYDNLSGRSRGFGFVTFKDPKVIETVRKASPHVILGKTVDCKKASPKEKMTLSKEHSNELNRALVDENVNSLNSGNYTNVVKNKSTSKIFVGGLPDLTLEEFRE